MGVAHSYCNKLLIAYMLLIYINIDFLIVVVAPGMVQRNLCTVANGGPTCEIHSPCLGCGLKLILAFYRESHAHSFYSEAPPPMACTCTTY